MLAQLLAEPGVEEVIHIAAPVGVMALHGGLETATAEAAVAVAERAGASLYGVIQPTDLRWHVPSTLFDPAESDQLGSFLAHVRVTVSLHGFSREGMQDTILLGGLNRGLAQRMQTLLTAQTELDVVADLEAIPLGLRGVHPMNPVNLCTQRGVQVELSPGARNPTHLSSLVAALTAAVTAEMEGPRVPTVG